MALSNSERQRRYRQRHLKGTDGEPLQRINMLVSPTTAAALARLATHYAVTKRDALERAVRDAEATAVESLTADDLSAYYKT